jgi:hypothetical protein
MLLMNACPICGDSTRDYVKCADTDLTSPSYVQTEDVCSACIKNSHKPYKITMLYTTSDGKASPCYTHHSASKDYKVLLAHLRKNSTTMGFSVQNAFNPDTKHVVSICIKGKMGVRLLKKFMELGYTEWFYSHAFSAKKFLLPNGEIVSMKKEDELDLISNTDLMPWARALGYTGV